MLLSIILQSIPKIFPEIDVISVSCPSNAPRFYTQTPGLNIITEYVMGIIYPGRPIANVCFKTYGYMSMAQAVSFLNDFKLGHYMKIPPRSMFLVQVHDHFPTNITFTIWYIDVFVSPKVLLMIILMITIKIKGVIYPYLFDYWFTLYHVTKLMSLFNIQSLKMSVTM